MSNIAKTEDLVAIYIRDRQKDLSKNTLLAYKRTLSKFQDFATQVPREREEDVLQYFIRLGDSFLTETGIHNQNTFIQMKGTIRSFYRWLYRKRYITLDPGPMLTATFQDSPEWQRYKIKKIQERKRSVLTEDEIRKVLRRTHIECPRDYIIFLLGFNLALRMDDLANIQRKHFMLDEKGEPQLYLYGKSERRSKKPVLIQMQPEMLYHEALAYMDQCGLHKPDDYLITAYINSFNPEEGVSHIPINAKAISKRVMSVTKDVLGRKVQGHYLRRSKVTTLRMRDISVPRISKLARMSETIIKNNYDCQPNRHDLGDHAVTL